MSKPFLGGGGRSVLMAVASSLYWFSGSGGSRKRFGGIGSGGGKKSGLDAAAVAHAKKKVGNALKGSSSGAVMATSWFGGDKMEKKKIKCMIPEAHIDRITTLVNELVDLDFFDEESEQRIFDDMIRKIVFTLEDIMPEDYHLLVKHRHPLGGGLSKEHAHEIETRAIKYVKCLLSFPYLDEADEDRVIQFVVKIICQSMREDRTLDMLADKDMAGELIVDVLMKGAVRKLFNKEEKEKIVEDVVLSWCKIFPFLPASTLEWGAIKTINWGAKHMEAALESSFKAFNAEMEDNKSRAEKGEVKKQMEMHQKKEEESKKDYKEHHECLEEDVEEALSYETCLIEHLEAKFSNDLPDYQFFSEKKKEMCHKLATLMVNQAVDVDKLSAIFHFLHHQKK